MAADGPLDRDPSTPATLPSSLTKPTPGSTWTDLETTHLIDVYEANWNSSKRGPLKAHQWEDVAVEVAARCGLSRLSKSGTQCRHKIEKLRKRYRSERLRPLRSLWIFFDRIDRMERGPLPISFVPPPPTATASSSSCSDFKPRVGNKRSGGASRKARKRRADEEDGEGDDEEGGGGREGIGELAAELRRLGEGYVRMERRKIEMMREKEREWMEMESRRLEMVMEAQRSLVETIAGAFCKKGE